MSERKLSKDHEKTAVLPTHLRPDRVDALDDAAAEAQTRYQEYLRSLDDLPVLVDVAYEPLRASIRDFRLGQRPDARKKPREDAAALREQHAHEVAAQYAEYLDICAGLSGARRVGPRKASAKAGGKPSAQKKRAKRAKRSARSGS